MWTVNDVKFLRSLRIASDNPPEPLPRFRVWPMALDSWYQVIDVERNFRPKFDFGPENSPNPRAAAEDCARQMNDQHARDSQ